MSCVNVLDASVPSYVESITGYYSPVPVIFGVLDEILSMVGFMEHATFWELYWERPAAIVVVALKLSKSMNIDDIRNTLDLISKRCDGWVGIIALKLKNDEKRLLSIINDLENGLKPAEEIVKEIESYISKNL